MEKYLKVVAKRKIEETNSEPEKKKVKSEDEEKKELPTKEKKITNVEVEEKKNPSKFDDLETYLTETTWKKELEDEFKKPYFKKLKGLLAKDEEQRVEIFPPIQEIFTAFNGCPFDKVKVVILGQDPYHGPNQAHGLSFSVKKGVSIPKSLQNIYKELQSDIQGFSIPKHGNLAKWESQGVLLLNTVLTVRKSTPNSHENFGWTTFTDEAIKKLSSREDPIIFLLWGKQAEKKAPLIKKSHKILKSAHPSPFSAEKGFFNCKHFSKCNTILKELGKEPIDWTLD